MEKKIGLIAGNGEFPLLFMEKAADLGLEVFVCALKGEADKKIEKYSKNINWLNVGQVKKVLKFFKKNNVEKAVMLGGVTKTRLFFDVRPDSLAIRTVAKLKNTHDDNLLRAFSSLMDENGIKVIGSYEVLPELLAKPGIWTKKQPDPEILKDILIGFKTAKKIGELDIGQTIVVSGGSVVAVEAVEGTDNAIRRGGSLCGKGGVVVKVSKPNQDMRFDIPAIGPETLKTMKESGIDVLAIEALKTNVLDHAGMISMADENDIIIAAVNEEFFKENGIE